MRKLIISAILLTSFTMHTFALQYFGDPVYLHDNLDSANEISYMSEYSFLARNETECTSVHATTVYEESIAISNDAFLLSTDDPLTYIQVLSDGTETVIKTSYQIIGLTRDGYFVIIEDLPYTLEDGKQIMLRKYGLKNDQYNVILQPALDYNPIYELTFDEYGIAWVHYGAPFTSDTTYLTDENGISHVSPLQSTEPLELDISTTTLLKSDGTLLDGYYKINGMHSSSMSENRYILNKNDKYYIIDSDFNEIVSAKDLIESVDIGKFRVDGSVTDHNGNIIENFPSEQYKNTISDWSIPYLTSANDTYFLLDSMTLNYATTPITRSEFCFYVVRVLKAANVPIPNVSNYSPFSDTLDENIRIAHSLGIIDGIGNGKFNPYGDLTREQAAKILVELCNLIGIDTTEALSIDHFEDYSHFSSWSKDFILQIASIQAPDGRSIMGGTSANTFTPQGTYTKEQAITSLVRIMSLLDIKYQPLQDVTN